MMNTNGTSKVSGGYYLSTSHWNVEVVPDEGRVLPAGRYQRVPFPLLFAVVPVIGLAFLIFLPFIGFALLGLAVVRRVTGQVAGHATSLAATVAPDLATGAAYLAGREGQAKPAAQVSPELEKLEKEISEKRS
jgi:hypothetical protein